MAEFFNTLKAKLKPFTCQKQLDGCQLQVVKGKQMGQRAVDRREVTAGAIDIWPGHSRPAMLAGNAQVEQPAATRPPITAPPSTRRTRLRGQSALPNTQSDSMIVLSVIRISPPVQ